MCGRYVSVSSPDELAERFDTDRVEVGELPRRYNVAPTTQVAVVVDRGDGRTLTTMRWGFVPFWAKQPGKGPQPINARVEGVADSRMFGRAFRRDRVIVPADGFYEWQAREGSSRKQPWYVHDPQHRPLAFAGIRSTWRDRDTGDSVDSVAILTRDAAGRMVDLHDRMPVVLPENLWATWLAATERDAPHLHDVIRRAGVPALEAHTVSDRVNNVRNDGPDLIERGTVEE
jgi:putative SOS response-associated peptidase YedK